MKPTPTIPNLTTALLAEHSKAQAERIIAAMRHCLTELPKEPLLELVVSPEAASFANASTFRLPPAWALLRSIAADCLAPAPDGSQNTAQPAAALSSYTELVGDLDRCLHPVVQPREAR